MTTITRFFFNTDEEYRKACDTLDKAIKNIQTEHFDHGKNAENKELWVIDPKKAEIIEGLFKQNGITQYDKKIDETSWIGPKVAVADVLRDIQQGILNDTQCR
jgi:hypothetical protein